MFDSISGVFSNFGFSTTFIEHEFDMLPSVFELSASIIREYLKIVKQTMKNHPMDVQAIEMAFYESDFNDVFEAFDLLMISGAEETIPIACKKCIAIFEELTGCTWWYHDSFTSNDEP